MKMFVKKIIKQKNFCSLTPLQNYFYKEIFLIKKDLVHARSIHSTTAEEYQHQSKQARKRLPHEANNQYGGGRLEQRCCVQGYTCTCIKTHGVAMRAVGEVLIC